MTFGFKRAEILSAQFNGATLLVLGLLIIYEGITRLARPPHVAGTPVLVVALVGIVVNLAATYTLSKANRQSMNVEGAFQHILTHLAAFIFTAIAGVVILTTGFNRADGIASLVIAAIMLRAAYGLLKTSGASLPGGRSAGLGPRRDWASAGQPARRRRGPRRARLGGHLRVPALSAHVLVGRDSDCHELRRRIERILYERFGVEHTTLQVDHDGGELLDIELPEQHAASLD